LSALGSLRPIYHLPPISAMEGFAALFNPALLCALVFLNGVARLPFP
jgi:hypothetical protein